MEKLQSLFKTGNTENLDSPITFSLIAINPYSFNGKLYEDKVSLVLSKDGQEFSWEGVEKKKLSSTNKQGEIIWQARVGDEIDITLRPPVPNGKFSWFFVCSKGFYKPDNGSKIVDTAKAAKAVFDPNKNPIAIQGILQALMQMDGMPSDEDVLALIDRSVEIYQMLRDRLN